MKVKAILSALFLCFALVFTVSHNVFAASKPIVQVSGNAGVELVAHFNKVDPTTLNTFKKLSKKFKDFSYKVNKDGSVDMVRKYPAVSGSVYVNGTKAKIDKKGHFIANVPTGQANIVLQTKNHLLIKENKNVKIDQKLNVVNIVKKINFDDYMGKMSNMNMPTMSDQTNKMDTQSKTMENNSMSASLSGTTISPNVQCSPYSCDPVYKGQDDGQYVPAGTHVHCNRFNGTFSDHTYWSESAHPAKAAADFIGSDCDSAASYYGCSSMSNGMVACDGLNVWGHGIHDCSQYFGWPVTAWYEN